MRLNFEINHNKRPFYHEFSNISDKKIYKNVKLENRMNMNLIHHNYLLNKGYRAKCYEKDDGQEV